MKPWLPHQSAGFRRYCWLSRQAALSRTLPLASGSNRSRVCSTHDYEIQPILRDTTGASVQMEMAADYDTSLVP